MVTDELMLRLIAWHDRLGWGHATREEVEAEMRAYLAGTPAVRDLPPEAFDRDEHGALMLYHTEGLIIQDRRNGEEYTNQTGGVRCNRSRTRGHLRAMAVPKGVKDAFRKASHDHKRALREADDALSRAGLPLRVDFHEWSEEAWLHVTTLDTGQEAILTWENSD